MPRSGADVSVALARPSSRQEAAHAARRGHQRRRAVAGERSEGSDRIERECLPKVAEGGSVAAKHGRELDGSEEVEEGGRTPVKPPASFLGMALEIAVDDQPIAADALRNVPAFHPRMHAVVRGDAPVAANRGAFKRPERKAPVLEDHQRRVPWAGLLGHVAREQQRVDRGVEAVEEAVLGNATLAARPDRRERLQSLVADNGRTVGDHAVVVPGERAQMRRAVGTMTSSQSMKRK